MARCCGGATCACKVTGSGNVTVTGTGTSQDPFVIGNSIGLSVGDNTTFDLTLTGLGTAASPWLITVAYAATAKLNQIPDVNAPTPTNGQVLSWNTATSKWVPAAPTTAASGSVNHDTSLTGDGSVGTPLGTVPNAARMLATSGSGVGLSDTGMNSLVRRFSTSAARVAADPVPVLNSLSMLDTAPGRVDYWDGIAWKRTDTGNSLTATAEMGALSGPWVAGGDTVRAIKQMSFVTDGAGKFTVFDTTALAGRAGVLTVTITPTGTLPFTVTANVESGQVVATAYRADDGTPFLSQSLSATVMGVFY